MSAAATVHQVDTFIYYRLFRRFTDARNSATVKNSEKCAQHFKLLREMPRKFSDFTKSPTETVITRND